MAFLQPQQANVFSEKALTMHHYNSDLQSPRGAERPLQLNNDYWMCKYLSTVINLEIMIYQFWFQSQLNIYNIASLLKNENWTIISKQCEINKWKHKM